MFVGILFLNKYILDYVILLFNILIFVISLIIFYVINIYISEPEPEPYIIDLIPDNISIPTPEWKNIDQNKVIQIVGGILGILSFGCLVKFLSDKVITSKSIKFTDWFMTGSQYHMKSGGNWMSFWGCCNQYQCQ